LLLSVRGLKLSTSLMLDLIDDEGVDVDAVCGILDGGASLATAIGLRADLPIVLVRKETKDHGMGGLLIGTENVPEGGSIIVVEDVTTTGGSALRGVVALREAGYRVESVFSVLDRNEGGGAKLWGHNATRLRSLFTKGDFSDKE
jgi:orotate phosphoribosyltransferase